MQPLIRARISKKFANTNPAHDPQNIYQKESIAHEKELQNFLLLPFTCLREGGGEWGGFMYPTLFGDAGVSLFVGGTIFGDVAVSLFVPGEKLVKFG